MTGLGLMVLSSGASGQAVSLGEAGNFTIVSSQGVTNSGPSIIDGNIALSPLTTITGFDISTPAGAGIINGDVHYNDAIAARAQNNALTAYNTLAGMAYLPANDLTGLDLGGRTLTPGVYHFETSAGLTGNLTLATLSDPNAVFVFQIGSTLTTATDSSVFVTGAGADTPNIFWQVGSAATLNSGTSFSGNILALASVSLGTGSSLANGRALALNGAVTLLSNSISAPDMVLAAPGRYWNGSTSNRWSDLNWSTTVAGLDQVILGTKVDVVFSVDPAPQNQDTILDADLTISSLTVNDSAAVTIGGTNTLTISASGLVTGININDGAGPTTISSNLELGYLSQVVDVNNAGGLLVSGVISGTSGLTKSGTGVLTLTGAETYTGPTVVSDGTLQLGDGITTGTSIMSSDSVFVSKDGVLAINLADEGTVGNSVTNNGQIQWTAPGTNYQVPTSVFSGTGSMRVTSPGTTILLGNNTFSGGTTIDTGGDVLVGNPDSNTSSHFGTGVLTLNNGTIDTYDSQLLQIGVGGYVQTGGEIAMHLEGSTPGSYTQYNVAGTASLSGGTVFVYDLSGNYVPYGGDVQNIIRTTGGLDGEFASNYPESHFYNAAFDVDFYYHQGDTLLYPTVTYDPDNAYVTWVKDSFQSVPGLTPNQNAVGGGLDGNTGSNIGQTDDVIAYLNGQNINGLPGMYDLMAPDELTAIFQMGFTAAEIQNANIQRHLERVRQGSASETRHTRSSKDSKGGLVQETVMIPDSNRWSVFIEGTGGSASVDGSRNANGYDFDTMGVTLGADLRVSDRFAVGVMGSYGKSDARLVNGGSIDAESYNGAVYATVFQDGFYVDALFGAGYNSYDTKRSSLLGYAEGSPDGWELNSMINTGYDFRRGNWTFSPTASIAHTRVTLDGFTETGSLSPLSYPTQHQDSLRTELGARIAYTAVFNGVTITPQLRIAWQHEFLDSTQSIDSRFAGGGGPTFTVDGPHMSRDRAVVSAGVSARINPAVSVYGFYDGHIGSSDLTSNQFSAGVKIDF
jgi:outer membrane autotransporter protein